MILSGRGAAINVSCGLYSAVNSTYETTVLYSRVVNTKVLSLASYFKTLGECSFEIASGDSEFKMAIRREDYISARDALLHMETGVSSCSRVLGEISSVELVGRNNESLKLDVGNLSSQLDRMAVLIEEYGRTLKAFSKPSNFSIFVSKESPMVTENVTIFGYAPNMSSVIVVINGTNRTPRLVNGTFSLVYSFPKVGLYEVYAVGINSSGSFSSNVLRINVTRISTRIIAEEERDENVTVSGYLLDYWGRGVPGARLEIVIDNDVYPAVTDDMGFFNITVNVTSEENATVLFGGTPLYGPSNMTLILIPAKLRPIIRLVYRGGTVKAGEPVTIRGEVSPAVSIPIVIYVDDSPYTTVTARGNFSFKVRLGEGTHKVYAYFRGNSELSASKSNVIQITATPVSYVERLFLLIAFSLLAGVGYLLMGRRKGLPVSEERVEEKKEPTESDEPPSDVLAAYRIVYRVLRRVYSLPPSITPREMLSRLRNRSFYRDLAELTSMHEKRLYARVRFQLSEVWNALKRASRIIITAVVGDEL